MTFLQMFVFTDKRLCTVWLEVVGICTFYNLYTLIKCSLLLSDRTCLYILPLWWMLAAKLRCKESCLSYVP